MNTSLKIDIPQERLASEGMSESGPGKTDGNESEGQLGLETPTKVEEPRMYRVLLINDDFTPMEFVILCLKRFFGKTDEEATKIMLDVHQKGSGTAGVFTLEVAEMKVMQVGQLARVNQHPLKASVEAT